MIRKFCGKGALVFTLGHLAAADSDVFNGQDEDRCLNLKDLMAQFKALEDSGVTRRSKRSLGDWRIMQHPTLGMLQWMAGERPNYDPNVGTTYVPYFYVRLNGKLVLQSLPIGTSPVKGSDEEKAAGAKIVTLAFWSAGSRQHLDYAVLLEACLALGTFEEGGPIPPNRFSQRDLSRILVDFGFNESRRNR
jgi:hypothetical protein